MWLDGPSFKDTKRKNLNILKICYKIKEDLTAPRLLGEKRFF